MGIVMVGSLTRRVQTGDFRGANCPIGRPRNPEEPSTQ